MDSFFPCSLLLQGNYLPSLVVRLLRSRIPSGIHGNPLHGTEKQKSPIYVYYRR